MKVTIVIFSIILMGFQCSAQWPWNNGFKPFWERRTSARPAAQSMTTTTTTTTTAPTTTKRPSGGFMFGSGSGGLFGLFGSGSSSSTSSGSSSSTSSGSGGFAFGSSSGSSDNPLASVGGLFSNFFGNLFQHEICPMIKGLPVNMDVQTFKSSVISP